jgi:hypothetical protein
VRFNRAAEAAGRDARCSNMHCPASQADKGRPAGGCWPLAESPEGVRAAIIEFSRHLYTDSTLPSTRLIVQIANLTIRRSYIGRGTVN